MLPEVFVLIIILQVTIIRMCICKWEVCCLRRWMTRRIYVLIIPQVIRIQWEVVLVVLVVRHPRRETKILQVKNIDIIVSLGTYASLIRTSLYWFKTAWCTLQKPEINLNLIFNLYIHPQ